MIKPTVGRVVHYYESAAQVQPYAATIAYAHSERMINISYVDHNGRQHHATSVPLLQDDDARPTWGFCEWMPYQKDQGAKPGAGNLQDPPGVR